MSTIKIIGDAALSASIEFDPSGAVDEHVAASDPHAQYLKETDYTAADVLTKLLTVDGAGSGLDADLLDGLNSAAFLRASGAATGATSSRQVFTNGITAPNWQPASDSTTALQMRTASGTAFVTADTTNQRVGIGTASPTTSLHIIHSKTNNALDRGLYIDYVPISSATGTYDWQVAQVNAYCVISNGTTNNGSLTGMYFNVLRQSGSDLGTLESLRGARFQYGNLVNPSTTTTVFGLQLMPYVTSGAVGTLYDIYLEQVQTGGTLTNKYGLYIRNQSAGSSVNYAIYTNAGDIRLMASNSDKIGFHGVTPVARQLLATGAGATVDNVITFLQNLGLAKQS